MKRVAVTGVGMISPGGTSAHQSWVAVRNAHHTLVAASGGRTEDTRSIMVAEVPDFQAETRFDRKHLAMLDPVSQYGIAAAREAVSQSGIDLMSIPEERTRCIIGTGAGGEHTHDESSRRVYCEGSDRVPPLTVPKIMVSAVASQIALEFGIKGGVYVLSSACASAAHAIGQAFADIRSGAADVAITGGSEACLTHGCLKGWQALHVLSDDLCRPFSKGRRGLVLGEGAAIFVLEEFEAARRRGADILAEIVGFGMSSDAASLTSPDAGGMARAMRLALADARLAPTEVDHVNAHGTGTYANDVTEAKALRLVFDGHLDTVPVTANKGVLGHALGASGAAELAMSIMALREQVIPPTANFVEDDPECPLDCVPNQARDARIGCVMSNSFAFGGLNASLVVRNA